jgi:hypothetical protein
MAYTVGTFGLKSLTSLAMLVDAYYFASVAFVVVVIGALARLHGFSLWNLIRYFREELLIIFGTSTSEPVFPRLILKLESLGCQKALSEWYCHFPIRSTSTACDFLSHCLLRAFFQPPLRDHDCAAREPEARLEGRYDHADMLPQAPYYLF